jgi:hypothetical protein
MTFSKKRSKFGMHLFRFDLITNCLSLYTDDSERNIPKLAPLPRKVGPIITILLPGSRLLHVERGLAINALWPCPLMLLICPHHPRLTRIHPLTKSLLRRHPFTLPLPLPPLHQLRPLLLLILPLQLLLLLTHPLSPSTRQLLLLSPRLSLLTNRL